MTFQSAFEEQGKNKTIRAYILTEVQDVKRRISSRFFVPDDPKEANVVVVFDDSLNELEDVLFMEKPVVFLASGRIPDAPKEAYEMGVPEDYILDAANLRISELKKKLEQILENPILPDPMVLRTNDAFVLDDKETYDVPMTMASSSYEEPQNEIREFLMNFPGKIITVTGLHGGVGVSTVAAGIYHHLKTLGTNVLYYSPQSQPLAEIHLQEALNFGTLPDTVPNMIIFDRPHDSDIPILGELVLVVEPTAYDIELFDHGMTTENFRGVLVVNKYREDFAEQAAINYFSVIQSYLRAIPVPYNRDGLDKLLKMGKAPDEDEPFASTIPEILETLF